MPYEEAKLLLLRKQSERLAVPVPAILAIQIAGKWTVVHCLLVRMSKRSVTASIRVHLAVEAHLDAHSEAAKNKPAADRLFDKPHAQFEKYL